MTSKLYSFYDGVNVADICASLLIFCFALYTSKINVSTPWPYVVKFKGGLDRISQGADICREFQNSTLYSTLIFGRFCSKIYVTVPHNVRS
jgi:hypothetical protein